MGAERTDDDGSGIDAETSGGVTRRTCLRTTGTALAVAAGLGGKAELTEAADGTQSTGYGGTGRLSGAPADRARPIDLDERHAGRFTTGDSWFAVQPDDAVAVRFDQSSEQGVSAVGVYDPDGNLVEQAYATSDRPIYLPTATDRSGTHYLQAMDVSGDRGTFSLEVRANVETDQQPYEGTVADLPGRIEAEHFDVGGEGVSYNDTSDGNEYGDVYRETDVDIRETEDSSGGYNVGYFQQGEWLEYTVDPTPGIYEIRFRVATPRRDRRLRVTLDGEELATVSVSNTGGWRAWETVTVTDVTIPTDSRGVLRLESLDSGIDVNWLEFSAIQTQAPYGDGPAPLPGRIEAENFDVGGEGISFNDTSDGNEYGDVYRETDVDIRETQDDSGDYNVGYVQKGEWLEYTVAPTSGTYDVHVRVATTRSNRRLRVTLDGEELGVVDVPTTGGWRQWETVTVSDVSLPDAESAVLRVEALASGVDLNWIEFEQTGSGGTTTQNPFQGTVASVPGRVEAEHFDVGGEGVSYHDTTDGNEYSNAYRETDVDVRETSDTGGGYTLGYVADGEWLEYTVDPSPGEYDVRVRVATPNEDRQLRLTLNGEKLGVVDVPATDGWRDWTTATLNDVPIETDAQSVLRLTAVGSGIDINWIELAPSSDYGEVAYGEAGYGRNTTDNS